MIKRGDKRAQGLSTNSIILIVLGVIVLVVLILGFTLGWSRIAPWLGSSNNVDQIVQECGVACSTNAKFAYCSQERTIEIDGQNSIPGNCSSFVDIESNKYGIQDCKEICN